jgi:hypothetical protein
VSLQVKLTGEQDKGYTSDMAPPFRNTRDIEAWWKNAYPGEHFDVQYEIAFHDELLTPGTLIKMKNLRGTFKFRCLVTNVKLDATWIDCIDVDTGEWKSFHLSKLKGKVKPKRSRRRKKVQVVKL